MAYFTNFQRQLSLFSNGRFEKEWIGYIFKEIKKIRNCFYR